jgi:hypothetical protein
MDESEPDHANYIGGGQWNLTAGLDAELLPAWVLCVLLSPLFFCFLLSISRLTTVQSVHWTAPSGQ